MKGYLLDTNIVIGYFGSDDRILSRMSGETVTFLCVPVVAELLFGAFKSARASTNIARIEAIMQASEVLACTRETARHYASIRYDLRRRGTPIPYEDTWIAAVARQHSLILATRDSHFAAVDSITIENW